MGLFRRKDEAQELVALPAEFEYARALLQGAGYEVEIPHDTIPAGTPWNDAMRLSLANMLASDGVAMLASWSDSVGAQLESYVARTVGIPAFSVGAWIRSNQSDGQERKPAMKITGYNDDEIKLSDGSTITYEHEPDCCEVNYADFSVLEVFYKGEEFDRYEIAPVEGGFVLKLIANGDGAFGYEFTVLGIYIPCYSDQNGYYASDVDIVTTKGDTATRINIAAELHDC